METEWLYPLDVQSLKRLLKFKDPGHNPPRSRNGSEIDEMQRVKFEQISQKFCFFTQNLGTQLKNCCLQVVDINPIS